MEVRASVVSIVPAGLRPRLRRARDFLFTLPYRGRGRYCPVCGRESRRFGPAGIDPRPDARCVFCGSRERHRLLWEYLGRCSDLFECQARRRMLHFAPEAFLHERLKIVPTLDYLSADIEPGRAMIRVDITDIPFPDGYFDVILCSHVLEHVADDRKAMRELARVLHPAGWAILMVPVMNDVTEEDSTVRDPAERVRRFGHPEHVRNYGRDFSGRLEQAGFVVRAVHPKDFLEAGYLERIGVPALRSPLYVARRQPLPANSSAGLLAGG